MKTGLWIVSVAVIMGLLAGMAITIPSVQAQDAEPSIVFHVLEHWYGSTNLVTIPPDSPDTIIISGSWTTDEVDNYVQARVQNNCELITPPGTGTPSPTASPTPTGTPPAAFDCVAADLYYKISVQLTWNNTWYIWPSGAASYDNKDLSPWTVVTYGGSDNLQTYTSERCGIPETTSGTCHYDLAGMIPAADISDTNPTDDRINWNEEVKIQPFADYPAGNHLTVSYTFIFSTSPLTEDCSGQYNIGATLATFNLPATDAIGVNLTSTLGMSFPAPGSWYSIKVESGTWHNNGSGSALTSLAMKIGSGGAWYPLTADPVVGCADETADTYYVQSSSSDSTYLRVDDTDGNFGANTGTLVVSVSAVAAYTPYPSGCELLYSVGDLIEQGTVSGSSTGGHAMTISDKHREANGPEVIRYYMLETIGGPVNLGSAGLTWEADLGERSLRTDTVPPSWYEIQTAPFVTCVTQTDIVGHVKVFFPLDEVVAGNVIQHYYSIRARDTGSYLDNSGTLGYRLYEATSMQMTTPGDTPSANGCAEYKHGEGALRSVTIQANSDLGVSLGIMGTGNLYGLQVADGPWQDAGITAKYTIEISDDGGNTWTDLQDYPGLLCAQSADGMRTLIYVYGAAGKLWMVRANDGDSNFGTNTGTISVDVYSGISTIDEWPNCTGAYSLTEVPLDDEQRKIPGNQEAGKGVPFTGLSGSATLYSVEIVDGYQWYEGGSGTGSYLVDISDDNGATWTALESYGSICAEQIGDGDRFQIYFKRSEGEYKLRVRDGDNDFLSNTGYLMFNLYTVVNNNSSSTDTGNTSGSSAPPEWVVACNETYTRPSVYFSWESTWWTGALIQFPVPHVGEWIDYLRSAITFYFAWCPSHTDKLLSIGAVYLTKEPLATINNLLDLMKTIRTMWEGSLATGGAEASGFDSQEPDLFSDTSHIGEAGGASSYKVPQTTGPWDMFMIGRIDPAKNVWFGGKVDLQGVPGTTDMNAMEAYRSVCNVKFTPLFGVGTDPYCRLVSLMRYSLIFMYALFAFDVFILVYFVLGFLPWWAKSMWGTITGSKDMMSTIKKSV